MAEIAQTGDARKVVSSPYVLAGVFIRSSGLTEATMLPAAVILENMVFHLANNMHFAGTAVKLQGKDFITVDQLHGRRFPAL